MIVVDMQGVRSSEAPERVGELDTFDSQHEVADITAALQLAVSAFNKAIKDGHRIFIVARIAGGIGSTPTTLFELKTYFKEDA